MRLTLRLGWPRRKSTVCRIKNRIRCWHRNFPALKLNHCHKFKLPFCPILGHICNAGMPLDLRLFFAQSNHEPINTLCRNRLPVPPLLLVLIEMWLANWPPTLSQTIAIINRSESHWTKWMEGHKKGCLWPFLHHKLFPSVNAFNLVIITTQSQYSAPKQVPTAPTDINFRFVIGCPIAARTIRRPRV